MKHLQEMQGLSHQQYEATHHYHCAAVGETQHGSCSSSTLCTQVCMTGFIFQVEEEFTGYNIGYSSRITGIT